MDGETSTCGTGEIEWEGSCVGVGDYLNDLIGSVSDDVFWKWVGSWKDSSAIIDEVRNWNEETQEEAIYELEEILKEENERI